MNINEHKYGQDSGQEDPCSGLKTRSEIPSKYKWNIEAMYANDELVAADIREGLERIDRFTGFKGHLLDSSSTLLEALDLYVSSVSLIEKAYVYSHMRKDEDNANSTYVEMYSNAVSALSKMGAAASFFQPELLEGDRDKIESYIAEQPGMEVYRFMLEEIMNQQEHTLSSEQEYILASLREVLDAPDEIFSVLNDVDMVYGTVVNEDGIETPLTHGTFIQFLESENRSVRKEAYEKLYAKYKELTNTISTTYAANVKCNVINSQLRHYDSSLQAALSGGNIPVAVYENLLNAVHKAMPAMHKYVGIRKKSLGVDQLEMYDVYTPLVKPAAMKFTFEEAVDLISKALAPLGEEYVSTVRDGLLNQKWADVYESKGKTSGAYSFGSYDSYPYILMNFSGDLRDVFTLIHESGHSMHSYYTRRTQPYIYGSHSIFTAEVASTVNETLLLNYLLDNCESDEMKAYLVNFYIDSFKGTVFRQTMFAEFEKITHEHVENGGSLTADFLNSTYDRLNKEYFGPEMNTGDMIQYEWSRIPHFYSDFYVYQYATGFSAANAIANRILNEGTAGRDDYLKFLTTGCSDYPIELLKIAGVDMSSQEPVLSALSTFETLVDQLDLLMA